MSYWRFEEEVRRPEKRANVALQALLFTPLAAVTCGAFVYAIINIAGGDYGYSVMLVVCGVLTIVLGYQALHFLRDLSAAPTASEGEISKKWTKGNLFFFFMSSHYIAVKGNIYTISRDEYRGLLEEDLVRIRHYPHSLTVVHVERFDETEKKFVPAQPDGSIV